VTPEVSVVVPTYKRPELLARCLDALLQQDFPADKFEIVIADDAADPATRTTIEQLAAETGRELRYVPVRGLHGPAAARNAGWRAARAPVIAFTDDDCVPDPKWLREGASAFQDGVAAVRGRVIMPIPTVPTDYELNASGLATAAFVTANCFCRRATLEAIGGFDEDFRRAWREDSEIHFRLINHGARIVRRDSARVLHPVRPAGWGISLRQQRNNLFEALLYKKHPTLYRRLLKERTPWFYYVIVASGAGAVAAALRGRKRPAAALALLWAGLTASFFSKRLKDTSRAPGHVAEMAVTSMLIPPLALYWRLRGAVRYRVPFL
jgi:glycosyltransferase involved in cell wall biosynthesis